MVLSHCSVTHLRFGQVKDTTAVSPRVRRLDVKVSRTFSFSRRARPSLLSFVQLFLGKIETGWLLSRLDPGMCDR